ncbi:hypothetical protein BCR36DRAFT_266329, partial [Piromyces finnis]
WINKDSHQNLTRDFEQHVEEQDDDMMTSDTLILDCIEWLTNNGPNYYVKTDDSNSKDKAKAEQGPFEFLREWIYLPMLYSKEKHIPKYLNDIRSISWADIPPRDKKMSTRAQERFTCETMEEFNNHRKFDPLEECHFKIHGKRSNHQSMDLLEQWLIEKNCPNAFHDLF